MHRVWITDQRAAFWLALSGITILAFALRLYRLADFPPGFHYDEAFNALDVRHILTRPLSQWPLFFTGNFGREPLLVYILALTQKIAGSSVVAMRVPPALTGALLTPALAWLGWEVAPMLPCHRRRLALWAGAAVLGILWAQIYARYVLRVELFALLATLAVATLFRAWHTARLRWFVVAGLAAGLAFYTYLPVRLLPAVVAPVGILFFARRRSALRAHFSGLAALVLVAVIVAAPLAAYFIAHPDAFMLRTSQVSVAHKPAEVLANSVAVAKMFFVSGDANPRDNVAGRPVLDWLLTVPFLAGLLFLLRHPLRPTALFLLSWFGVMLLPTILSEYAPSFQRAIGALPVVALIVAVGLDRLVDWLNGLLSRLGGGKATTVSRLPALLASVLLLGSICITWRAFVSWSLSPDLFDARDVGFAELAEQLTAEPSAGMTYVSPRGNDHPTLRYLTDDAPMTGFNGASCVRVLESGAARYVFLVKEDPRGPDLVATYLPDARSRTLVTDPTGAAWAVEMMQPADGRVLLPEMQSKPVAFADGFELLGYWLSDRSFAPGCRIYVRLFWRATGMPSKDYTTFVHLIGPAAGGQPVELAGADAQPGGGSCNTASWRQGEIIVDELQFVVPQDRPAGALTVEVGMYDLASGGRVPRVDGVGDAANLP